MLRNNHYYYHVISTFVNQVNADNQRNFEFSIRSMMALADPPMQSKSYYLRGSVRNRYHRPSDIERFV